MIPMVENGDFVSRYVNEILACYYKLSSSDLVPSPSINCVFERLVDLYGQAPSETITNQVGCLLPT